ncbi:MAG: hypothetical protein IJX70_03495 [Clostridia bacterium]|nr:hypothetical protein [Clostridia bacterium]
MKKKVTILIICIALVACLFLCAPSSLAWYTEEPSSVFSLTVDASGFLAIYIEAPIDPAGEEDRALTPAVAMDGAVMNGLPMDVTRVYNAEDDNPSYVKSVAIQKTYTGEFTYFQDANAASYISYSLTPCDRNSEQAGDKLYFANSEFVYAQVDFVAKTSLEDDTVITHYPLYDTPEAKYDPEVGGMSPRQSADKTSGELYVEGSTTVQITVTLYFANVSELIDPHFYDSDSIWFEIGLRVTGIIEPEIPECTEHVDEDLDGLCDTCGESVTEPEQGE